MKGIAIGLVLGFVAAMAVAHARGLNARCVVTLAEFIEARLADEERIAQGPRPGEWEELVMALAPYVNVANRAQMWAWAPARVLAECAATRAIIGLHTAQHDVSDAVCYRCITRVYLEYGEAMADFEPWPCLHLRLLAQPYASHADFDTSWVVSGD